MQFTAFDDWLQSAWSSNPWMMWCGEEMIFLPLCFFVTKVFFKRERSFTTSVTEKKITLTRPDYVTLCSNSFDTSPLKPDCWGLSHTHTHLHSHTHKRSWAERGLALPTGLLIYPAYITHTSLLPASTSFTWTHEKTQMQTVTLKHLHCVKTLKPIIVPLFATECKLTLVFWVIV